MKKEKPRKHVFNISIDDGYDEILYPLELTEDISIQDIYEKLCKAFKVEPEKGTLIAINGQTQ